MRFLHRNPPNKFSLAFLIVVLFGGLRQKTPNLHLNPNPGIITALL